MTENGPEKFELIARFFEQQILDGVPKEESLVALEKKGFNRKSLELVYAKVANDFRTGKLTELTAPPDESSDFSQEILDELTRKPMNLERVPMWKKQAIYTLVSSVHRQILAGSSEEEIILELVEQDFSWAQAELFYQRVFAIHEAWKLNPRTANSFLDFVQVFEEPADPPIEPLVGPYVQTFGLIGVGIILIVLASLLDDPIQTIYFDLVITALVIVLMIDRWRDNDKDPPE